MEIIDRTFGGGDSETRRQPTTEQRFDELTQKYDTVLNEIQQQLVQLQNLHVVNNKLFISGLAPSFAAKEKVWDQIRLVDPNYDDDLICDIDVDGSRAMGATVGGEDSRNSETYAGKSGDPL